MKELEKGDIVQIVDEGHAWFPALLIVDEVKSWGVQAVTLVPKANDGSEPVARLYNRLPWALIEKVGKANIVPE